MAAAQQNRSDTCSRLVITAIVQSSQREALKLNCALEVHFTHIFLKYPTTLIFRALLCEQKTFLVHYTPFNNSCIHEF